MGKLCFFYFFLKKDQFNRNFESTKLNRPSMLRHVDFVDYVHHVILNFF